MPNLVSFHVRRVAARAVVRLVATIGFNHARFVPRLDDALGTSAGTSPVPASPGTAWYGLFRPFGQKEGEGLEQSVLRCLGDSGGARGDVELVQDVGDVPVDRVLAESEPGCDLFVAQSLRHEAENLHLSPRQAGGSILGALRRGDLQMSQERRRSFALPIRPDLLED